jgi:hypothetical protein
MESVTSKQRKSSKNEQLLRVLLSLSAGLRKNQVMVFLTIGLAPDQAVDLEIIEQKIEIDKNVHFT